MTTNLQNSPYLPRQRNFPSGNSQELGVELDKSYIEIASRVNERTIGLFAVGFATITGEGWYLSGQPNKQQTLRQVYTASAPNATNPIPHGINFASIDRFTAMYGQYTDGTNDYGLISASNVAIAGQITFYLTPNNIEFLVGAGAPTVTQLTLVLEWLSAV